MENSLTVCLLFTVSGISWCSWFSRFGWSSGKKPRPSQPLSSVSCDLVMSRSRHQFMCLCVQGHPGPAGGPGHPGLDGCNGTRGEKGKSGLLGEQGRDGELVRNDSNTDSKHFTVEGKKGHSKNNQSWRNVQFSRIQILES